MYDFRIFSGLFRRKASAVVGYNLTDKDVPLSDVAFRHDLLQWLETLRSGGGGTAGVTDESPEAARRALEQCAQHRAASLDACAATIAHGEALLQDLRHAGFLTMFSFKVEASDIIHTENAHNLERGGLEVRHGIRSRPLESEAEILTTRD
ncbi:jg26047 [Pararge aegeria aegeria]|uniref:Jg26047 protein n=1 Tax=Pararge aegeria aegeria TaxID=348720 RepID=A0A8S4QUL3_9NEOP|nr:jg26047 [Pararge aegeria aegeria]